MQLQEEYLRTETGRERVGGIEDIIIDGRDEEGIIGRSKGDAPEIDGMVFIEGDDMTSRPAISSVLRLLHSNAHDLSGLRSRKPKHQATDCRSSMPVLALVADWRCHDSQRI